MANRTGCSLRLHTLFFYKRKGFCFLGEKDVVSEGEMIQGEWITSSPSPGTLTLGTYLLDSFAPGTFIAPPFEISKSQKIHHHQKQFSFATLFI